MSSIDRSNKQQMEEESDEALVNRLTQKTIKTIPTDMLYHPKKFGKYAEFVVTQLDLAVTTLGAIRWRIMEKGFEIYGKKVDPKEEEPSTTASLLSNSFQLIWSDVIASIRKKELKIIKVKLNYYFCCF